MKLAFKFLWERFATAIKIDPPQADSMFDAYSPPLEDWTFDVRRSLVFSIDQTCRCFGRRFAGGGTPDTL